MKRRTILVSAVAMLASPARAAVNRLRLGEADVTVEIDGETSPEFQALAERWVKQSASAVMLYYDRFPVPQAYIHIVATGAAGVRGGQTFPGEVPLIRVQAGGGSSEDDLLHKDWVLVHEMIHLAFPWMNRKHNWMAEGLAVYVESIARLHAGHLTPVQVWGDFAKMMPRGLPKPGEGGYEVTVNWGRTYWGGAVFCLLADIAIRQRTDNRMGLQHALRAINATRDFRREWDFAETLAIGDKATGTDVLTRQNQAMGHEPAMTDLPALWQSLGVDASSYGISFDETAPLAAVRRAIEKPI